MYYYSSGYLDDDNVKVMQGVVKVEPREDKSNRIVVHVGGIKAKHGTGGEYKDSFLQQSSINVYVIIEIFNIFPRF